MNIGVNEFWDVLRGSNLFLPADLDRIQKQSLPQFDLTENDGLDSQELAKWLVSEKLLTKLQAKVLLAGHSGPFDFGRYRIVGAIAKGGAFLARDRKTGYPVWLHFMKGDSFDDLSRWSSVESLCDEAIKVTHPNLVRAYEWVATPNYRFVVTAVAALETLEDKLPLKRRLPWDQAGKTIAQVAAAVSALEGAGIVHGDLQLSCIHWNPKGKTQVLLPFTSSLSSTREKDPASRSDLSSLGRIYYRMLLGRDAPGSKKLLSAGAKNFSSLLMQKEIPGPVSELIFDAIVSDVASSEDDSDSSAMRCVDFLNRLCATGVAEPNSESKPSQVEAVYLETLVPWAKPNFVAPDAAPKIATANDSAATDEPAARPYSRPRKQNVPLMIAVSLTGFAAIIGLFAFVANMKTLESPRFEVAAESSKPKEQGLSEVASVDPEVARRAQLEWMLKNQSYVQELVPDDSESLWESPTTGFPVSTEHLPPSPRMLFFVNWTSVNGSEAGAAAIKAMGPKFDSLLKEFETRVGFTIDRLDSSRVSLHSNEQFEYESFSLVKLKEAVTEEECLEAWGDPDSEPGLPGCFTNSSAGTGYWIVERDDETNDVLAFAVGPSWLTRRVADGEVAVLTGTLLRLAEGTDSLRDVNLIVPKTSLFNTEGQKLFASRLEMMREIRLLMPDSVRGMLISFHFDSGDYLELRVDHTADTKPREMVDLLRERIADRFLETGEQFRELRANEYWEPIRKRFPAMLRELAGNLRWDTEFGEVIGNAWLRPKAFHNLIAASELAMAFEPVSVSGIAATEKEETPATLRELLASKRDLKVANPPDLNVLLQEIRSEVLDQYPQLSFEFNIRIAGADLQMDGITQNQRPAALEIVDKSLSDILTSIMVAANPNRNITGANDPDCKLIWVVTDDPEGGEQQVILVTTRDAARKNNYVLPAAFELGSSDKSE